LRTFIGLFASVFFLVGFFVFVDFVFVGLRFFDFEIA
jgi:hypothetical protein